jgi:DNA recombination protein RmuC
MDWMYALGGVVGGGLFVFLFLRGQATGKERDLREQLQKVQVEKAQLATELEQRKIAFEDQKAILLQAEKRFSDAFASLSQDALAKSADQFLRLAKENFEKHSEGASGDLLRRQQAIEELVKPLKETLDKLDTQTQEIEQKRLAAYEGVTDHINRLMLETSQLSNALRKPHVRGSWGELTLRKAAESAGLIEGQDFEMQFSTDTDEGRLRPDMVVHLPNKGVIVVDSKVPLDSYLDAMEAADEVTRALRLKAHAAQVKKHVVALSSKAYWNQFERSPDFVVMFVPAESLYQTALEQDPELLEAAFKARVVLANPMTLIALLRTVAFAMKQEKVQENAEEIRKAGERLYDSIRVFSAHMAGIGKHLGQANDAYNKAVGSMERNVLSKSRQLRELGAGAGDEIDGPESLDVIPRSVQIQLPGVDSDQVERE